MRALVLGATGVLGRQTWPILIERGHQVRAVVRHASEAERLRRLGVDAVLGDILDAASLIAPAEGCDAVFHLATAIPRPGGAQNWVLNDRIRREGTRNLLAAAERAGARRYIQESITLLYGDQNGQIANESTPIRPVPLIQSAADMEAFVQASPLAWTILRAGSLYGPGTGREADWLEGAKDGTLRLPGSGGELISLIRALDFGRAAVLAAESAPPHRIYNVVDDEPVTYRTLYSYIAALTDTTPPPAGGEAVFSLGCSNARLKAELGWSPAYATYRSGLADCIPLH